MDEIDNGQPAGVVYCSCVDWNGVWERMHQFAWMFAGERPVLFVDNPGTRPLRWDHLPRIADRLGRALRRGATGGLHHADRLPPNLHLLAPLLIPSPTDQPRMVLNRCWLRRQVDRAMRRAGLDRAILWTSAPTDAVVGLLDARPWDAVIYDCVDDLPALHPSRARQLQAAEDALVQRADAVLATSRALVEKLHARGCVNVHYVPNGIDFDRFAGAHEQPTAIAPLPRPVIGFLGSMLANVFDLELVLRLAAAHPEWSVTLVGPMDSALAARAQGTPVRLIGPVDYAAVPACLRAFDVALVPFHESALTRAINPLKVYEYLACGLPVVSTPLPELDGFGDLVTQVTGARTFDAAVVAALAEGRSRADVRATAAAEHDWHRRFTRVTAILAAVQGH